MMSFIVYLLEQAKNVGSGKVHLELTLEDKTIEFKDSEWRLYSSDVTKLVKIRIRRMRMRIEAFILSV